MNLLCTAVGEAEEEESRRARRYADATDLFRKILPEADAFANTER